MFYSILSVAMALVMIAEVTVLTNLRVATCTMQQASCESCELEGSVWHALVRWMLSTSSAAELMDGQKNKHSRQDPDNTSDNFSWANQVCSNEVMIPLFRYSHQHAAARGNMNLQLLFAERLMATMADMQSLSMQVTFPLAARRHVKGCLSPAV